MKRIIQILLLVLMTFSLFATSKPSLDGRAVVADEGILPRGLFAKTVGYLPGDSVSVTNPATGVTVNVLVLGSLDPSAGIAIMLSPEAADKLFISPNINTQVKITKRMGLLDQASTGSAILSADPDKDTEASIPSDLKEDLDSRLAEYDKNKPLFPEDLEELPLEEEVALVPEELPLEEEVALVPEELPLEEEVALVPEELPLEEEVTLVPEELPLEEEVVILPEEIITEEIATNELSDKIQDEEILVLPLEEEVALVPEELPLEEEVALVPEELPLEEEVAIVPEELPLEDEVTLVPEELPLEEEVALVPEELPLEEEVALVPEELPLEEEVALVPEELPLEEEVDPYAPIILVPAEDNPPQAHIAINPEPVVVEEETPSKEEKIASIPVPVSGIIVDSLSKLESGKYYVQIATLTQQENIDQIVQTYGTKYPIIMVPLKSGTAYQIMVGPLTVDEYGSVISKFKSFGYKDAFLRKIR